MSNNNEERASGGRTNPTPRPTSPSTTANNSSGGRSNPNPRSGSGSSGNTSKGK